MNARTLSAGLASVALISLALGCERERQLRQCWRQGPPGSPQTSALQPATTTCGGTSSASIRHAHPLSRRVASARANDGSKITLTGSGTYRSNPVTHRT